MKSFVGALVFACLCPGPALAAPTGDASAADTFRQLTQDWENAVQSRDLRRVSEIEHDDYRNVGPGTLVSTKQRDLAVLQSGTVKHVVAEFGPMDVKMLGEDVAVVQGTLTDRSTADSLTTGQRYVFMDVWVLHGGKWSIIRSQSAKVK